MSQKKLNEIKMRIDKHFINELNIMSDILEHLTDEESKELRLYMEDHPHKPSQIPEMMKKRIKDKESGDEED